MNDANTRKRAPGAGRKRKDPKGEKRIKTSFTIPASIIEWLGSHGVSRSDKVVELAKKEMELEKPATQ